MKALLILAAFMGILGNMNTGYNYDKNYFNFDDKLSDKGQAVILKR